MQEKPISLGKLSEPDPRLPDIKRGVNILQKDIADDPKF